MCSSDLPTENTTTVYSNGEQANKEPAGPLNTWSVDNTAKANPLPFRVGSQSDDNGGATAGLRGSMTIAKIRVYDQTLNAEQIAGIFASERYDLTRPALKAVYNSAAKRVDLSWNAVQGVTYSVEISTDLHNWAPVATGLTSGSYQDSSLLPGSSALFYRLTAQ